MPSIYIVIQGGGAFAIIDSPLDRLRWREHYPAASHLVIIPSGAVGLTELLGYIETPEDGEPIAHPPKTLEDLAALGGVAEARADAPSAEAALAMLGVSPLVMLEAMDAAKAKRDLGLYPMRGADGHQIFANGAWQWVPAEKKDWVFDQQGNRIQ